MWDVLNKATARGIDVRLIFWRPDEETAWLRQNAFWGSEAQFDFLSKQKPGLKIRWDRAHPGYCQHQKSWLIDAGTADEIAFVGGINLNPHSMVSPGHEGEGQNHDVYVELKGPSVVDVHHNFVQRWNEASERLLANGCWGAGSKVNLDYPISEPLPNGNVLVQIQRTIHPGRYFSRQATPGGTAYAIDAGEQSNYLQYCAAINAARSTIYIENQQIDVPQIIDCLKNALERGVEVVMLMPVTAKPPSELAVFDNCSLAGIAGLGKDGCRKPVYVHAKLMLIDDEWATVGSCNLHRFSLFGNSEMNVAFSDNHAVRNFRSTLFQEHIGLDTSKMDDHEAILLFRTIAKDNRKKAETDDPNWRGIAFEMDFAK
jgi:cardiolipin synthase